MFPAFLLALREGLEAALIIGILLGALRQIHRSDLRSAVWQGAASAALLSIGVGGALHLLRLPLAGPAEAVYEGLTMLLAAGVLTWMIFWMHRHARHLKSDLETQVQNAASGGRLPLFLLAFLAVVREGVELALFLTATTFTEGLSPTLLGAGLGLLAAVALGWSLFASLIRLDLRRFFAITGALLTLFAAGLVAHGVHEFNEVGWIPAIIEHVWDTNALLPEKSALGRLLTALFGYNGNPSLTEVLAYWGYLLTLLVTQFRPRKGRASVHGRA